MKSISLRSFWLQTSAQVSLQTTTLYTAPPWRAQIQTHRFLFGKLTVKRLLLVSCYQIVCCHPSSVVNRVGDTYRYVSDAAVVQSTYRSSSGIPFLIKGSIGRCDMIVRSLILVYRPLVSFRFARWSRVISFFLSRLRLSRELSLLYLLKKSFCSTVANRREQEDALCL